MMPLEAVGIRRSRWKPRIWVVEVNPDLKSLSGFNWNHGTDPGLCKADFFYRTVWQLLYCVNRKKKTAVSLNFKLLLPVLKVTPSAGGPRQLYSFVLPAPDAPGGLGPWVGWWETSGSTMPGQWLWLAFHGLRRPRHMVERSNETVGWWANPRALAERLAKGTQALDHSIILLNSPVRSLQWAYEALRKRRTSWPLRRWRCVFLRHQIS